MRRLILYLLILGVVLFYVGAAGAAAEPYYSAFSGFISGATGGDRPAQSAVPRMRSSTPAPSTTASYASPKPSSMATVAAMTPAPAPTVSGAASATATLSVMAVATARPTVPGALPVKGGQTGTRAGGKGGGKGTAAPTLTPHQLTAEVQRIRAAKAPQGRINFLILGSDNDPKFQHYTHPPTQVMIVLSLDTVHNKITMLSISRDLWVRIPGYPYNTLPDGSGGIGWSKIMIASKLGFNSSACTVENDFGIPIDHWIWVGLKGFTNVIDTLHGATVDATHPVVDDTYPDDLSGNPYAYRRIYIPPGPQHLNGNDALHFVRSRHGDSSSDFGRSDRQQILIDQLRRQFAGQDTTALALLLPKLLGDFSNELKTDATIDGATAIQYLKLVQALKQDKPTQVVLQPPYSFDQTGYDHDPDIVSVTGQNPYPEDALGANWRLIDPLIARLFGGQVQHPSLMPKDYCKLVSGAVTQ